MSISTIIILLYFVIALIVIVGLFILADYIGEIIINRKKAKKGGKKCKKSKK